MPLASRIDVVADRRLFGIEGQRLLQPEAHHGMGLFLALGKRVEVEQGDAASGVGHDRDDLVRLRANRLQHHGDGVFHRLALQNVLGHQRRDERAASGSERMLNCSTAPPTAAARAPITAVGVISQANIGPTAVLLRSAIVFAVGLQNDCNGKIRLLEPEGRLGFALAPAAIVTACPGEFLPGCFDEGDLVDLLQRGDAGFDFGQRRFPEEMHTVFACRLANLRARPLFENHLANAVGQLQQFVNRGSSPEAGAGTLDAAFAFVEHDAFIGVRRKGRWLSSTSGG